MRFVLNPYIAIPIAVLALAAAGMIWYVLVRPTPEKTAVGVIADRTFREEERVEKSVPQTGRSVETGPRRTAYTRPDRHVYTITIDGYDTPAHFAVQHIGEPEFEVGQRVHVRFLERRIPFVGRRLYVQEMTGVAE